MNIWTDWANARNTHPDTQKDKHSPVPLDISSSNVTNLDYWLSRFILEIRCPDGKPYPPRTLQNIASAIQRYLRDECNSPEIMLFRKEDPIFHSFRLALYSRMKELTAQGVGLLQKRADPVTPEDESKCWESGTFGFTEAKALS